MMLETGLYSLSSRPEFYLQSVDEKIPPKAFYCNFFDRTLEEAYLEYEKSIQPQRKRSQTPAAPGNPPLSPAAPQAQPAQSQSQTPPVTGQKRWKDRREYDLFQRSSRESDPRKKLDLLDEWNNKYPDSDFRVERLTFYLNTYKALNQPQQTMDSARKIVAIQPNNLEALYWICTLTVSMNDRAPDRLDLGRSSANALLAVADAYFVPANKPAATSDSDWANAKTSTQAAAHQTLDWIAGTERSTASSPSPAVAAAAVTGQDRVVTVGNAAIDVPAPERGFVTEEPPIRIVTPGERYLLEWRRPVPNWNIPESAKVTTGVNDADITQTEFEKLTKRRAGIVGFQKSSQFFSAPDAVAYSQIVRDSLSGSGFLAMAVVRVKQKPLFLYLSAPFVPEDNVLFQDQVGPLTTRVQSMMEGWVRNIFAANR